MLKIIFGNIARKDHYYLNKKYIKKQHLALKVTEKIKKKKKIGRVGLAGPMLSPMPHSAQSSYLPCKAQSYVTFKKKKKEKKKA